MNNLHIIAAIISAVLGWLTVAYESALQELSISRLDDIIEEKLNITSTDTSGEQPTEKPFVLTNIINNIKNFRLATALASSFFLGAFLVILIFLLLGNDRLESCLNNYQHSIPIPYFSMIIPLAAALIITGVIRGSAQAIGERKSEVIIYLFSIPTWIITLIFRPVSYILLISSRIIARGVGIDVNRTSDDIEDDVIAAVTDSEKAGIVNEEQREMIERVFDFNNTDVADIFTPRTDMQSISASESLSNAIKISLEYGHSRLPVHEDTRDNIIGIFYVRDALNYWEFEDKPKLVDIIHKPAFVPETQKVVDLLQVMQKSHTQIAIVLDEYGGTAGLVTIEDILEELVGEIQDEYDKHEDDSGIRSFSKYHIVSEGQTHVFDINKALDEDIIPEDHDYETIGGFVLDNLGHIPHAGEEFRFSDLNVKILDADERRVLKVEIKRDTND